MSGLADLRKYEPCHRLRSEESFWLMASILGRSTTAHPLKLARRVRADIAFLRRYKAAPTRRPSAELQRLGTYCANQ